MKVIAFDILLVVLLAMLPGFLWVIFFYGRDKASSEPHGMIVKVFFAGMLSLLPAIVFEMPFKVWPFVQVVLIAPVVEELLKFTVIRTTVYRNTEFNTAIDGITCSATLALGFATAENVYYIVASYLAPQIALGQSDPLWALGMIWKVYIIRALLTIPGHAIWSSIWGFALGWTKCRGNGRIPVARSLLLSMVMHGLFNYFVITRPVGALGMLVLVPSMWKAFYNRINRALEYRYSGPCDR